MLSRWIGIALSLLIASCGGGDGERNGVIPGQPRVTAMAQTGDVAPVLFGSGTATVDGAMGRGEWAMAHCLPINVNVPEGTTPGTVCAMNDALNLYLLVRFARPRGDPVNVASFEFDNDSSGDISAGDDVLLMNPGAATMFFDDVRTACGAALCGPADTDVGGTRDGSGAFGNDGTFTTYEFSHPLNSGDARDFSLAAGDSIGFWFEVRFAPASSTTQFATFASGKILVTVPIDVQREKINAQGNAPIPIALLSTASFDAPATVDPDSLTFGRTGDEASLASCRARDVNGDGIEDLLCRFSTRTAGFQRDDTFAILKGTKRDGGPIAGIAPLAIR